MRKEKKQDLPEPEQQAAEDRVRQLMDPAVPDEIEQEIVELPTEIKLMDEEPGATPITDSTEQKASNDSEPALAVPTAPILSNKTAPQPIAVSFHVEEDLATSDELTAHDEVQISKEPDSKTPESEIDEQAEADSTQEPVKERFTPLTDIRPQAEEAEPAILTDPKTAAAVDEIIAEESDEILRVEDRERELAEGRDEAQAEHRASRQGRLSHLWHSSVFRWTLFLSLFAALVAVGAVPSTRYFILNSAGAQASASLLVLDESSGQPLKNVRVSIAGKSATTGTDGKATLTQLALGPTEVKIEKRAFAVTAKNHVIGWGSNPLGDFKIKPIGAQYVIKVNDYLSEKPLSKVEAVSGEASALSNDEGEIRLTSDEKEIDSLEVTLKAEGYRQEKIRVNLDDKQLKAITLVPTRKHAFVSKRSGKLDVFKIDVDGKNEERILAGTGTEREDMVVTAHPTDEVVVVVSSRENKRNRDGFLLSTLTAIDLRNNETRAVITSERIQIIDWVEGKLVFVVISEGASANNPKRHRLMSYDIKSGLKDLATSNFFNDVTAVGNRVYYAPSSELQKSGETGLIKLDAQGGNKEVVLNREVWNIFRTSYDHLAIATPRQWYDYRIGDKTPNKLEGAPANQVNRNYVDSPDGKRSLWVDTRDGKGVLLSFDTSTKTDTTIRSQSGLEGPVRWISNNTLVFRIDTDQETADFALSLDGGEAKKIRDVTGTDTTDKWYFYQ